ncbi:hypothetical protein P8452_35541 [Trifolium repens]|nr:hypothetical protein P8452_35541 [Trifolium repens]
MLMQNEGSCKGCLENERIGLLEIKHYILSQTYGDGDHNKELSAWVDDRDSNCCTWDRVQCSNTYSGHITELYLYNLLSYGSYHMMNVSLFRPFEELSLLDLSANNIGGWTDNEDVHNLRNLNFLSLSYNDMNGSVEGLCQLKDLQELDISNNKFSGQLPDCLSNLTNLRVLDVGSNLFSGRFPSFTSNLTSLAYLSIYENYMNGSFSLSTLANHSNLQVLYISSKSIGAHIETENTQWFPKFQLKSLILRNCNLNMDKGSVIPTFLSYQYHLLMIVLSRNKLVGSFPSWLIHNHGIQYLDISNNNLNGLLPKDIGIFLPNVSTLDISWNSFEGNIPSSIGKMKKSLSLDFSHNYFSGELPKQLAIDCDHLEYLKLSNNFLSGNIPKFSNSRNMEVLFLNNNNFSGTLEDLLRNKTSLTMLHISNNSISGTIPSSIGMLSDMYTLLLGQNLLEGEIPVEISNMTSLEVMDLSQNKLIGSIPKFSNMKSLRFLYLGKNDLSGSIPFNFSGSSKLELLDLTDNQFSGKIPNWMDKLAELRVLLLGGNNFEGDIPTQLCLLKNITIMNLSRNMLNSSIPSCFRNLPFGRYHDGYGPIFETQVENGYIGDIPYFSNSSLKMSFVPDLFLDDDPLHLEAEFTTKHMDYYYKGKVLENMTGLDLSCNRLTGMLCINARWRMAWFYYVSKIMRTCFPTFPLY